VSTCLVDSCPCLKIFGPNYDSNSHLLQPAKSNKENTGSNKPILECNSVCTCTLDCSNRVIQKGIKFQLVVFHTDQKGWGIYSTEPIPSNAFICSYSGEVITLLEAKKRQQQQNPDQMNYILIVHEHVSGGSVITTCIDPTVKGNIGRFINHSCSPNLVINVVRVDSPIPEMCLFSSRGIPAYEELCYDYGSVSEVKVEEHNKTCIQRKPCFCGSTVCKGYLPYCDL